VIDRVHFIINNITIMNIEQKVKELKTHVVSEFWPWFANYLVVKRAAQVSERLEGVWALGQPASACLCGWGRAWAGGQVEVGSRWGPF